MPVQIRALLNDGYMPLSGMLYLAQSSHLDGTGIGLSLVKHIIEVHEGKIWGNLNRAKERPFCSHFH